MRIGRIDQKDGTDLRITIVHCFETHEDRVDMLCKVLRADGHAVTVVCSDWNHFRKCTRTEFKPGSVPVHAKPYRKNLSLARILSHRRFAEDAIRAAEKTAPDLLWVFSPPNFLIKYAALFKQKCPDVKLILDFIDIWPETMPIRRFKNTLPFRMWKDLRDRYANVADLVVAECDLFRVPLEKTVPAEKISTLYFGRDLPEIQTGLMPPEDRIALCYLGSINNIVDIDRIAWIIENLPLPVKLHIIGGGEREEELVRAAACAGAEVVRHGNVYDPLEKQKIFDSCHFGLNTLKDTVFIGVTMKSVDYFAGGLPILNTLHGDTEEFVERYGIGINVRSAEDLKPEALRKAAENRPAVRRFYEQYFSEEVFSKSMHDIINRL
ncbi:MAG: glycosyltransferase [Oscillospiraceae bacterium]|nr:glycosyltransferase [Oscillospiraceae bacterium]